MPLDVDAPTLLATAPTQESRRDEVLVDAAVGNTRRLSAFGAAAWLAIALVILAVSDRHRLDLAASGAAAAASLGNLGLALLLRQGRPAALAPVAIILLPWTAAAWMVTWYVGFFSPMLIVHAVIIYVIGGAPRREIAFGVSALVMITAAIGTFGIAFGWIPDIGKVHPSASRGALVGMAVLTQVLFAAALAHTRRSRAMLASAVARIELAARSLDKRDALLGEAHADLARALHARAGKLTGQTLGSWQLGQLLGAGGMGEVYEASNMRDARRAAVKVLPDATNADRDTVQRFWREAEALARIDHPNVVKLFEIGDGFLAMERLEGSDLAEILRGRGMSVAEVVNLITQVAAGLEAARAVDVIHRDVKPQNIFFDETAARWKVLDFGIAKLDERQGTLTGSAIIGTPSYMAPEQLAGEAVDHRCDVFALTLVAYRAFTGRPAFSGDPVKVAQDILLSQPAPPGSFAALPPDVELVLAIGLAKHPEHRFARAEELAAALDSAAQGRLDEALRRRGHELLARKPWRER